MLPRPGILGVTSIHLACCVISWFLFVRVPHFPVSVDVAGGGDGVNLPVVAAEPLEENQCGIVSAKPEQAVKRVLDVVRVSATR